MSHPATQGATKGERLGYARVLPDDPNPDRHKVTLQDASVDRTWIDRAGDKNIDPRPELARVLAYARRGDELVVPSLDRFARSLPELHRLIDTLTMNGVTIRVLNPPLTFTTSHNDPAGQLTLDFLGSITRFERELLLERQREGIARARQRDTYKGRQPTNPELLEQARDLVATGVPVAHAARQLGISRSVLVRAGIRATEIQLPTGA